MEHSDKVTAAVAERYGLQNELHKLNLELLDISRQAEESKMRRKEITEKKKMIRDSLLKLRKTLG